jgi:hypothetical protein
MPHIAESTVLYYIDEIFSGDLKISMQDGPEFSHYIGKATKEVESEKTTTN